MRLACLFLLSGCTLLYGDPLTVSSDAIDFAGLDGGGDSGSCDKTKVAGDVHNCGRCGHDCTLLANVAQVSCTAGQCVINSCIADRAHCSSHIDDGCETDISKPEHCGGCNSACGPAAPLCSSGATHSCVASCSGQTPTQCGQSCVDTQSDIHHCGDCPTECSAGSGELAACSSGKCVTTCKMDLHRCSGACVANDVNACGSSCTVCDVPTHGQATCDGSNCGFTCDGGYQPSAGSCVPVARGIRSIALGDSHTCAVKESGAVFCWGYNKYGELGNNSGMPSNTPVAVAGLTSGVTAIDAYDGRTCALLNNGSVKCWGRGQGGTPTDVTGFTAGVTAISVGGDHGCAVLSTGAVQCWGAHFCGQLGDGRDGLDASSATPVDVVGLSAGVASISAGFDYSCALLRSGGIKCWGSEMRAGGQNFGQIGNGSNAGSTTPVDVSGLTSGAVAVSSGSATCALTAARTAKCWGRGDSGELGNGLKNNSNTPVDVIGISGAVSLSARGLHACVVLSNGALKCWGYGGDGQLGNDQTVDSSTPVDVSGLSSGVVAAAAGISHSCALLSDGKLKCWGNNDSGQVGDGTNNNERHTPVDVVGF